MSGQNTGNPLVECKRMVMHKIADLVKKIKKKNPMRSINTMFTVHGLMSTMEDSNLEYSVPHVLLSHYMHSEMD